MVEPVNYQVLFNIALSVIFALGGMAMRVLWNALKDLREADAELTQKVHDISTLVAGEYVKRTEMDSITAALFAELKEVRREQSRAMRMMERMAGRLGVSVGSPED